jgi:DNA-binding MarR family transcriptional regulator
MYGMTKTAAPDNLALASQIWQRMFGFFISTRYQRDQVMEQIGFTPNDARAFYSLDEHEGRSMRSLADEWGCDASNATWMVDRLEKRGFAQRQTAPGDRRVKLVTLTPLGAKTRAAFLQAMNRPPPELLALSEKDLELLWRSLQALPEPAPGQSGAAHVQAPSGLEISDGVAEASASPVDAHADLG